MKKLILITMTLSMILLGLQAAKTSFDAMTTISSTRTAQLDAIR